CFALWAAMAKSATIRSNAFARADARRPKDAAWHDGGGKVVDSEFPPSGGNGNHSQRSGQNYPPAQPSPQPLDGASNERRRFAPRSPRTALEPEKLKMTMRQSKRTRNPFVMVGNALFTLVLLIALIGGVTFVVGKQR